MAAQTFPRFRCNTLLCSNQTTLTLTLPQPNTGRNPKTMADQEVDASAITQLADEFPQIDTSLRITPPENMNAPDRSDVMSKVRRREERSNEL